MAHRTRGARPRLQDLAVCLYAVSGHRATARHDCVLYGGGWGGGRAQNTHNIQHFHNFEFKILFRDMRVYRTATLCNMCDDTRITRLYIRYADEHSKQGGGHLVFGWISTGKRVQHSAQQSLDVIISQSVHLVQQAQSSARRIQPLDAPFAKAAWCVDRSRSIFRSA